MEFEHLPVELGIGAVHLEIDGLAQFGRHVAHDARQFLPGIANRLHPRLQHAFLQLGGDVREALQRPLEFGIVVAAADLDELIARQHQLGDHGHQLFECVDMNADRLLRDLGVAALVVPLVRTLGHRGRMRLRHGLGRILVGSRGLAEGAFEFVERDFARA